MTQNIITLRVLETCCSNLSTSLDVSANMMRLHCFLLFLATALPVHSLLTKCYWPNGDNATSLFVCLPNADYSHCCRNGDVCITNGLCFSPGLGAILRRGCTDSTFQASPCTDICGSIGTYNPSTPTPLTTGLSCVMYS